ncbi:hypothetical protein K402DRAFT_224333 [Aulographum hederae CBS 113979]|uniref:Uncharacterized protein n=1 Tax=Aulographum hederae CBS 113979 TaxID=1176131 RepID=A0A6G1HB22_9PEZI|nr:hypothetical protein K402DRAFT_224333 [Aulographum hederae CBS 113979]
MTSALTEVQWFDRLNLVKQGVRDNFYVFKIILDELPPHLLYDQSASCRIIEALRVADNGPYGKRPLDPDEIPWDFEPLFLFFLDPAALRDLQKNAPRVTQWLRSHPRIFWDLNDCLANYQTCLKAVHESLEEWAYEELKSPSEMTIRGIGTMINHEIPKSLLHPPDDALRMRLELVLVPEQCLEELSLFHCCGILTRPQVHNVADIYLGLASRIFWPLNREELTPLNILEINDLFDAAAKISQLTKQPPHEVAGFKTQAMALLNVNVEADMDLLFAEVERFVAKTVRRNWIWDDVMGRGLWGVSELLSRVDEPEQGVKRKRDD